MVTTRDGLWLGAWDKEAFAAYTQAAIDAAVAEARAVPEFDHSIGEGRFTVVRGAFWWHIRIGDGAQNVGKFHSRLAAEDVALKLLTAYRDGAWTQHSKLAATPSPAEQPKPAVVDLPDSIRVPLHRLWADAGYLIGRAKNGETDLAVHTIKALCDELERAIRAALSGEQT